MCATMHARDEPRAVTRRMRLALPCAYALLSSSLCAKREGGGAGGRVQSTTRPPVWRAVAAHCHIRSLRGSRARALSRGAAATRALPVAALAHTRLVPNVTFLCGVCVGLDCAGRADGGVCGQQGHRSGGAGDVRLPRPAARNLLREEHPHLHDHGPAARRLACRPPEALNLPDASPRMRIFETLAQVPQTNGLLPLRAALLINFLAPRRTYIRPPF